MYRFELDLDLYFVPPMEGNHGGITVTRSFTLPFPPTSGLAICGRQIEAHHDPHGFDLHDVVWDTWQVQLPREARNLAMASATV